MTLTAKGINFGAFFLKLAQLDGTHRSSSFNRYSSIIFIIFLQRYGFHRLVSTKLKHLIGISIGLVWKKRQLNPTKIT